MKEYLQDRNLAVHLLLRIADLASPINGNESPESGAQIVLQGNTLNS